MAYLGELNKMDNSNPFSFSKASDYTDEEINKRTNKFLKDVTNNLENFSYNKIIANFHEIYSFLSKQITSK